MTFKITISLLIGSAALAAASAVAASAQDVAAGEKTFNVCRACHEIGDGAKNLVGPVLNGVVGPKIGIISRVRLFGCEQELRHNLG
jgi:cytochrome c2